MTMKSSTKICKSITSEDYKSSFMNGFDIKTTKRFTKTTVDELVESYVNMLLLDFRLSDEQSLYLSPYGCDVLKKFS